MIVFSYKQLRKFTAAEYNQDYELFRNVTLSDLDRLGVERRTDPVDQRYDIFLSHSITDFAATLGVKELLESQGLSVYIDWLCDSSLIPTNMSRETTERLLLRMERSRALVYVFSVMSRKHSVWMPWKLGYFHGKKGKVAVVGVGQHAKRDHKVIGNEFLLFYPYLISKKSEFFVGDDLVRYANLRRWVHEEDQSLDRKTITDPDEPSVLLEHAQKEVKPWP